MRRVAIGVSLVASGVAAGILISRWRQRSQHASTAQSVLPPQQRDTSSVAASSASSSAASGLLGSGSGSSTASAAAAAGLPRHTGGALLGGASASAANSTGSVSSAARLPTPEEMRAWSTDQLLAWIQSQTGLPATDPVFRTLRGLACTGHVFWETIEPDPIGFRIVDKLCWYGLEPGSSCDKIAEAAAAVVRQARPEWRG
jgi:hypothetical protein